MSNIYPRILKFSNLHILKSTNKPIPLPFPSNVSIPVHIFSRTKTGCDADEIRKAFREKAKLYHPDLNADLDAHEDFIRVHTAYEMAIGHLNGKYRDSRPEQPVSYAAAEVAMRRAAMKNKAEYYARMKYEEFVKECEAYRNSPYSWVFRLLYYGLYYLYLFAPMVFVFVPLWAGYEGGIGYFLICSPLLILSYFTVKMANGWKKRLIRYFLTLQMKLQSNEAQKVKPQSIISDALLSSFSVLVFPCLCATSMPFV